MKEWVDKGERRGHEETYAACWDLKSRSWVLSGLSRVSREAMTDGGGGGGGGGDGESQGGRRD